MAQEIINVGTGVNTGDGDSTRVGFQKTNDNFTELYSIAGAEPGVRGAADQAIVNRVAAEEQARAAAVAGEAQARAAADQALATRMTAAENAAAALGSTVTTLSGSVATRFTTEQSARANADSQISGQVEALSNQLSTLQGGYDSHLATLDSEVRDVTQRQQGDAAQIGALATGLDTTKQQFGARLATLDAEVATVSAASTTSKGVTDYLAATSLDLGERIDGVAADLVGASDRILPPADPWSINDPTCDNAAVTPKGLRASLADALLNGDVLARPGDAPRMFGGSIAGGDPNLLPADMCGNIVSTDGGTALRVSGSGRCATRQMFPVEPGRTYKARWVVQQRVGAPPPLVDAVKLSLAWYDGFKVPLQPGVTVWQTVALTVVSGRVEVSALVSLSAAGVNVVAPSGTCYTRLFADFVGETHVTDVQVMSWDDVTDADVVSFDASTLSARVTAIESVGIPARLNALEGAVTAPNALRFASVAAAKATAVAPTVLVITTLGHTVPGVGGATYTKSATVDPLGFQTVDGAQWSLGETRVTAAMCGAMTDGSADAAPVLAALPAGRVVHLDAGTYLLGSPTATAAVLVLSSDAALTGPGASSLSGDVRRPGLLYPARRRTFGEVLSGLALGQHVEIDCWGDGVTYGVDATATGTGAPINGRTEPRSPYPWPETLGTSLAQAYGAQVNVVNKGNPGDTASAILARLQADAAFPDVVILCCGGEDAKAGVTGTAHRTALRQLVELLLVRGVVPILLLPTPLQELTDATALRALAAVQRQVAREYDLRCVDAAQQLAGLYGQSLWTDGQNLTPHAGAELGWHLAGLMMPTGGDGSPVVVSPGRTLYPQDLAVRGADYAVEPSLASGYVTSVPQGASQVAVWCEMDCVPVVHGYQDGNADRSVQVLYAAGTTGAAAGTLTMLASGAVRATFSGPSLARGLRVLTLFNAGTAPFLIEYIAFAPRIA